MEHTGDVVALMVGVEEPTMTTILRDLMAFFTTRPHSMFDVISDINDTHPPFTYDSS